ncbi:OmpA family protein [Pseudomarimonas salicorniae]|uniref:OmpA family protein n=1 Tax=Pseudomarimonas salicorniae TaxID=2933270 RepID=A0ABT0GFC7_9GAMM|nr:OmpA family protein [Lysobacter sp. CAU 1642]MCK7593244.1 OmpA family protein [Lysobacter sp. CAU 1642]
MNRKLTLIPIAAALLAAGCASRDTLPPELVRLDQQLDQIQSDSRVAANAPELVDEAGRSVEFLHREVRSLDDDEFSHRVYLADRLIQTARAEGLAGYAETQRRTLAMERESLQRAAAEARLAATRRQRDAAIAEARMESVQRAAAQDAALVARMQAEAAEQDAEEARRRAAELDAQLAEMKAEKTAEGWNLTLGDVLFEVDKAVLKPGAERQLSALAEVLRDNPAATVAIEGHTDSTGNAGYNQSLSERRAQAVASYLASEGIERTRIESRGLGASYPVASNATPEGRSQNRRVDVLISTGNRDHTAQVTRAR